MDKYHYYSTLWLEADRRKKYNCSVNIKPSVLWSYIRGVEICRNGCRSLAILTEFPASFTFKRAFLCCAGFDSSHIFEVFFSFFNTHYNLSRLTASGSKSPIEKIKFLWWEYAELETPIFVFYTYFECIRLTECMRFNQKRAIFTLSRKTLKLVDHFTYLGSTICLLFNGISTFSCYLIPNPFF